MFSCFSDYTTSLIKIFNLGGPYHLGVCALRRVCRRAPVGAVSRRWLVAVADDRAGAAHVYIDGEVWSRLMTAPI